MSVNTIYKPTYENSWALIIGINRYDKFSPLGYACNDANAVADILSKRFNFPQPNIKLLIDKDATRSEIIKTYLGFKNVVEPDDRILVFFAGHGHTVTGSRGEVGFLIPADGDPRSLDTLLRWDDLTKNAELIQAKHILFIMDACYGGLVVTRGTPPGSMRFVKDMLQRFTRQALSAGKADETVADAGGPRVGHSIFTGHLLEALEGKAATPEGILSANGIMAYVYDKVATDHNSNQTPHYGFIEGDGDFIFDSTVLESKREEQDIVSDVLFLTPPQFHIPKFAESEQSLTEQVKDCLTDTKHIIRLDDIVNKEIRKFIEKTSEKDFPVHAPEVTIDEFANRLKSYEALIKDLQTIVILLSKWGRDEHLELLEKIYTMLGEIQTNHNGYEAWNGLRWYPIEVLFYSGGISALAANKYRTLCEIFNSKVVSKYNERIPKEILYHAVENIHVSGIINLYKRLPGYEDIRVARSQYLFKILQPPIEDLLFIGSKYEQLFDRFEIIFALTYVDINEKNGAGIWGPPGRFASKFRWAINNNPYIELLSEANQKKENWQPIKYGLFQGSYIRFEEISRKYQDLLSQHA